MTRQLDVLLINPGCQKVIYQFLAEAGLPAKEPPVWAALMATYIRLRGFSVAILDANIENLDDTGTAERITEARPLLAAFVAYGHNPSASTQTMPLAGAVAKALKNIRPDQKVLFVGGHVAALPERTLREEATDFTCTGEGPVTLVELIEALRSGDPLAMRKVRGLCYWEDGAVATNPPAPIVRDLVGEMPAMAWDLLPIKRYRAHNWQCLDDVGRRTPYAAFYTSLGCPYGCNFCCINSPFESGKALAGFAGSANSYRMWPPAVVVDQMEMLAREHGVRTFKIADEMFVLNKRHVLGICGEIVRRGLGDEFRIWAYSRVDTAHAELLDPLCAAGFSILALGIEAADAQVRASADKGEFGQEEIFHVVETIHRAGIDVLANYIFGLPEDTQETMQATYDLAVALDTFWANFYCAMAYPGSALYREALAKEWPLPETWLGYSQHSCETLPLPTRTLTGPKVLAFRDQAFLKYFSDPAYLKKIEGRFGPSAAEHVKDFVAKGSPRRRHAPAPV